MPSFSSYVPTAPATPIGKATASSPLGGGDRFSDSLFGSLTGSYHGNSATKLHGRALRRASPAPIPLSQYSTPPRSRFNRTSPGLHPVEEEPSPTVVAIGRSFSICPPAQIVASPDQFETSNQALAVNDIFFAVSGPLKSPERPVFDPTITEFPFVLSSDDSPVWSDSWDESPRRPDIPTDVEQASFSAIEDGFFASCKLPHFNPSRPTSSNFDILIRFGRLFGPGITKTELKQIFRRCTACQNLIYADKRSSHCCTEARTSVEAENFDIVQALLSADANAGLSSADFARIMMVCDDCKRLCLTYLTPFHECCGREKHD